MSCKLEDGEEIKITVGQIMFGIILNLILGATNLAIYVYTDGGALNLWVSGFCTGVAIDLTMDYFVLRGNNP